jgi:DNA-binding NarL/FixJ family response regulator
MEVRVLLVDDHPPMIAGYKSLLENYPNSLNFKVSYTNSIKSAYDTIINSTSEFDIITLDISMPAYEEKNLKAGTDLIPFIRKHRPKTKIIVITSHTQGLILFDKNKEYYPEGIMVKSDFTDCELSIAFTEVLKGNIHYSETVQNLKKVMTSTVTFLDNYSRQIIILLSQGVQTKNLPEYLNLSQSAIDKRKAIIKEYFNIEKGNDEDILREARKQGLI